jgi:nitrogen fixation-related uncharacterized protein
MEYMLYVSVIVIALVAIAWIGFGVRFGEGYDDMKQDAQTVFSNAQQEGSNNLR